MDYYLDSTKLAYLIEISFVLNLAYLGLKSFKIAHGIQGAIDKNTVEGYVKEKDKLGGMHTHADHVALHTAYKVLIDFREGDGAGWKSNRRKSERRENRNRQHQQNERRQLQDRRHKNCTEFCRIHCWLLRLFYKLLRNSWDRRIAKFLLMSVVLILIAITFIEADHKQQAVSDFLLSRLPILSHLPIRWRDVFWGLLFPTVVFATFCPMFMMFLSRGLVQFVLGTKEAVEDAEDIEKAFAEAKLGRGDRCGRLAQLSKDFWSNFQLFAEDTVKKETQTALRP